MINNRQGGRRRGRGGQRPQSIGGRPDGNRQDNRQRGNAAQLLEKYKSMARDAQLAGDRVQTEYYLQFADHYYRVLGESRARFDEQRRQRGEDLDDDENDDDSMDASDDGGQDDRQERPERPQRRERYERSERPERAERPERSERSERAERPRRFDRDEQNADERSESANGDGRRDIESIPFEALPPAIGRTASDDAEMSEEEAPRPRRRARRPRPDGDADVAPAA